MFYFSVSWRCRYRRFLKLRNVINALRAGLENFILCCFVLWRRGIMARTRMDSAKFLSSFPIDLFLSIIPQHYGYSTKFRRTLFNLAHIIIQVVCEQIHPILISLLVYPRISCHFLAIPRVTCGNLRFNKKYVFLLKWNLSAVLGSQCCISCYWNVNAKLFLCSSILLLPNSHQYLISVFPLFHSFLKYRVFWNHCLKTMLISVSFQF